MLKEKFKWYLANSCFGIHVAWWLYWEPVWTWHVSRVVKFYIVNTCIFTVFFNVFAISTVYVLQIQSLECKYVKWWTIFTEYLISLHVFQLTNHDWLYQGMKLEGNFFYWEHRINITHVSINWEQMLNISIKLHIFF